MDPQFVWAVASIYYQVQRGADGWVTPEIHHRVVQLADRFFTSPPLEIDDALDLIRPAVVAPAGTPPRAFERWAAGRAIVKLFGAKLLDHHAPRVLALYEALQLPNVLLALDMGDAGRLEREMTAEGTLIENGMAACAQTLENRDPSNGNALIAPIVLDPLTATLTLNSKVEARLSLAKVAASLDPQSWPQCSPFFEQVFVMRQLNGDYSTGQRPPLVGTPEPVGKTWTKQPDFIYEKFVLFGGLVSIENVLSINATLNGNTYDLHYALEVPWFSRFFWGEGLGGLSADGGFARAVEVDVGSGNKVTNVTAQKILGFQDREFSIPGVDLMYLTAALMQFAMDQMFLEAICCSSETPHPEFRIRTDEVVTHDYETEDYGSDIERCRRYVDSWLGFWREKTTGYLDDAAPHWVHARDKYNRFPIDRLTDAAFNWWSDALHLWVDAGHRCFGPGERARISKNAAFVSLLATNDLNQVSGTFDTYERVVPSAVLVGHDGKNRSEHLMVRLLGDGRAEVIFKPSVTRTNGRKVIKDGVYHGVILKANSLKILATVHVLKKDGLIQPRPSTWNASMTSGRSRQSL